MTTAALPGPAGAGAGLWERLVAAAVLGTERRPFTGLEWPGRLGAATAAAAADRGFAGVVAAVWAYRQAGRSVLSASVATGMAAPEDPRPLLPAGPVRTLGAIISDVRLRPVLPEWLHLAAADGRRLPPEWLPDLLDALGSVRGPVGEALEAAAGPRLSWLAGHPAWSAAGSADRSGGRLAARALSAPAGDEALDGAWSAAADEERIAAFAAVRRADPAAARRLAEHVWPAEPGSTRGSLVARFEDGLSPDDEPFLEARLDDRRGDIRREAARLLSSLPGSRLGARMAARTLPHVRLGRAPEAGLAVSLPTGLDAAARRDGLGGPAAGRRSSGDTAPVPESQRGGLLVQMIAGTPLSAWEASLRRPPEDLVALAASSAGDCSAVLLEGWSRAAAAQRHTGWAGALLGGGARPDAGLVALVPTARADRAVVAWLQQRPLTDSLDTLSALPGPWSPAVSRAVLDRLAELVVSGDTSRAGPVRDALGSLALAVHPGQAPGVAALAAAAAEQPPDGSRAAARLFWSRQLAEMVAVVHFRQAMYQEFR